MRANNLDNKKRIFELVNEFSSATFLKLKISNIQLNLIVSVIIKFELTISIYKFDLNDLSEKSFDYNKIYRF